MGWPKKECDEKQGSHCGHDWVSDEGLRHCPGAGFEADILMWMKSKTEAPYYDVIRVQSADGYSPARGDFYVVVHYITSTGKLNRTEIEGYELVSLWRFMCARLEEKL